MAISLRVFGDDLTTDTGVTLQQAYAIQWMRERFDPGSGAFTIPSDSPSLTANPGLFDDEFVVEVRDDATPVFLMLADRWQRSRGDVWDPIQFAGPSAIELLRRMLVYPYRGVDVQPVSDERVWSWTAFEYPDDNWGQVSGSKVGGVMSTPGFPDSQAVGYEPLFPGERTLYRRLMEGATSTTPAQMVLAAAWNTAATVYLDGEEILKKEAGSSGLFTVDVEYADFDREIAVEVKGVPGSTGAGRWGLSWIELLGVDDESNEPVYGSVLRRTFDPADFPSATPWLSYEGDQAYPGVTPGFILGNLLAEGQARGVLAGITKDFDDDTDSAGNLWPRTRTLAGGDYDPVAPGVVELAAKVFDDGVLDVAERMQDLGVEVELDADRVLHAWQDRGVDRTAAVSLSDASQVSAQGENDTRNVLVARTARSFIERTVAGGERREGFVSLGLIPSDEAAERTADDLVGALSEQLIKLTMVLHPSTGDPEPGVAFDLGDAVTAWRVLSPSRPWALAAVQVDTVRASVDQTGDVAWTLEARGD